MVAKNPYYSTLISIIILGFSFLAAKVVNWLWFQPKKLEKYLIQHGCRGNRYRPPLGDLLDLASMAKKEQPRAIKISDDPMAHALHYIHYLLKKYGEKNTFIWLGPSPTLLVSDPQLLKEILAKPNIFQKSHPDPIVEPMLGGLLYLEGEKWTMHRKIVNPSFHMEKLKNMVSAICLSCSDMIGKWESLFSSTGESIQVIDVLPDLENLTGDVISRTAFGSSHAEGRRIFELQKELVHLVLDLMIIFIPGWRYVPTKANRRMKALMKEIHALLRGIIKRREKALEEGEEIKDLLATLMESNKKEIREHENTVIRGGMSIEDMIEECKLFYFAGSETTSSVLVWTIIMLSIHKEWQTRAREEVLKVFGEKEPTFDGLNQLKTVTMILLEVMRLYTPVPAMNRTTTKEVKLGDITLPKRLNLILLPGLLHHDPKTWGDDANEFKPERFSEGVLNASKIPFSLIPFSSGPRVCVGQHFAMIEAKLTLVMILRRFSFELSETYLHAPFLFLTLQPQHGAPLAVRKLP